MSSTHSDGCADRVLASPQLKTYPQSTNLNMAETATNNDGTEESPRVIMPHEASGVIFDIDRTLADRSRGYGLRLVIMVLILVILCLVLASVLWSTRWESMLRKVV